MLLIDRTRDGDSTLQRNNPKSTKPFANVSKQIEQRIVPTMISPLKGISINQFKVPKRLILPLVVELDHLKDTAQANPYSFYVASGYNYSYNKYKTGIQSQISTSAEDPGHSFNILIGSNVDIRRNYFLSFRLTYQSLKSSFMYSENLGQTYSAVHAQFVRQVKHICHNNKTDMVGFRLGIGRDFKINNTWGSQLLVSLSSDYQLKTNGRAILEDGSVYYMENHQATDRLIFGAQLELGLYYQFEKFRITSSAGYQQGLTYVNLLDASNLEYTPHVLSFNIGIGMKF